MAIGYLIATWPPTDDGRTEAARRLAGLADAPGWTSRLQAPGVAVWTRGPRTLPVTVAGERTVVVGHLFPRGAATPVRSLPAELARWRARAAAEALIAGFWGSYVALLGDAERAWLLRDPSGGQDVMTWRCGALALAASDLVDLPPGVSPPRLALDWDAVTDFLRRPASIPARSGFEGVETVTPGDLHPAGGGAGLALWRPAQWARRPRLSEDGLQREVRGAVEAAVSAALAPCERALIEVSGGLDSAIVALSARELGLAEKLVAALHFRGDRPEFDERAWAQRVFDALGRPAQVEALEIAPLAAADFETLARGARPAINALDVGRDRQTAAVCRVLGADGLITGKGGDAVFFQHPTPHVLSDLVAAEGWRRLLGAEAQAIAERLRRSIWSVAWEAVRGLPYRPRQEIPLAFWGPRTREIPQAAAHPWMAGLEDLPPAKRYQIGALAMTQVHRGATGYGEGREVLHPLMAQPVMELCLSIPTWVLQRGGRDRALARAAFVDRLPAAIVTRRSKGELGSFYARLLAQNRAFLRDYLGGGCLAEAGVLDPQGLDQVLQPGALIWRAEASGVLNAVVIEAWVRHWQTWIPDAASAPRHRP